MQIEDAVDNCPMPPPSRTTVQTRVLHRACQRLGGVTHLAQHLGVPESTVYRWLEGEEEPPTPIFLKAVDVVMPEWGPEDDALARELTAGKPRKPKPA
jgi:hypothetical protein